MRAKIYNYVEFDKDGLIKVFVDRDMLKIIRNSLEQEIYDMCEPPTYDKMLQLIEDYKSVVEKITVTEKQYETNCKE